MIRKFWTAEELDILKEKYPNTKTEALVDVINHSLRSIYGKAKQLGLKKSPDFLNSPDSGRLSKGTTAGAGYRFKPGQIPPNKGKKMEEFMKPEQIKRFKENMFKAGDLPHNTCKDWEERIITYSDGHSYIRIKVPGIRKLVFKHHWLYIQKFGTIPDKHIVRFIDGNSLNCTIENLECIPKKQNMANNSIMRFPEELRKVIHLLTKLNKLTKEHEKQD
jgi:hypothetical protein